MKLSKSSLLLLSFFKNRNCIPIVSCNNTSKKIFRSLFNDIYDADLYLQSIKNGNNNNHYKRSIRTIKSKNDLPVFNNFPSNTFTKEVQNHIHVNMKLILNYSLHMFNRKINIHFIIEKNDLQENNVEKYDNYMNCILLWSYILNKYSSIHCSKDWNIYLYFTSLEKQLPNKNIHLNENVLNYNHINTGFTTTCPQISEIVIFRKEEWFKVFIHESFHNFALDFSDMNVTDLNKAVLDIFPIKTHGNLFEAYTEFWAEIINISFCSYFYSKPGHVDGFLGFLKNVEWLIQYERIYSFFQLNKVLNYMGLTYKNLYSKDKTSVVLRETLYKENTNIFAYYVIKCMFMNNYNGFLTWCYHHNGPGKIIQFSKTQQNLYDFYSFIKKNYKTVSFENNVDCMEKYMLKWQKNMYSGRGIGVGNGKVKHSHMYYLLNNMKMSIFELE